MTVTFDHTFNHTLLAYLLSLKDYGQFLTSKDKQNLHTFANEFSLYPDDIEYVERFLVEKIAENPQLNQLFQNYQNKLDNSDDIPRNLLPKLENLSHLIKTLQKKSVAIPKGEIPDVEDDATPEGQERIIHNSVIVISELISESDEPKKVTDKLTWIDKMKQWLG